MRRTKIRAAVALEAPLLDSVAEIIAAPGRRAHVSDYGSAPARTSSISAKVSSLRCSAVQ